MNEKIKKILKVVLIIANILLVLGAIGVLGYYLWWQKFELNLKQQGFNIAISQVVQTVLKVKEVSLPLDKDNSLILINKESCNQQ